MKRKRDSRDRLRFKIQDPGRIWTASKNYARTSAIKFPGLTVLIFVWAYIVQTFVEINDDDRR